MIKILLPHRRTDNRLFDNGHRCRERTGTDQQRKIIRFTRRQAGDDELTAQGRIDSRMANKPLLFIKFDFVNLIAFRIDRRICSRFRLDKKDVHQAPNIVSSHAINLIAALRI